MKTVRRSLCVALVSALALSGLGLSASADEPDRSDRPAQPAQPVQLNRDRPLMAAGVIVRTTTTKPSAALVRAAESELSGDVDVAKVRAKGNKKSVLMTSRRIPAAEAVAVADELNRRSDVVSASPNYISYAFGEPPVTTNDTMFSILKQIWDPRTKTDSRVKVIMGSSNSFPTGGYSSKASSLWRATKGEGQVVAVLDTGITAHPDLDDQILPGYDMVSDISFEGAVYNMGRDGDGRDPNPQDQGDWEEPYDCYDDPTFYRSSWHGTHVAGILGAEADNSIGVAGVASKVKILPVRVLGVCGGTVEDIADGIRWAAGVHLDGAVDNANPADVINLSLGGYFPCTNTDYVAAIAAARAAGSVVVAAAGNGGDNIGTDPVSPATCKDVISVGSTSAYGDRAGFKYAGKKYVYSNYGSTLDISAPGGDEHWDGRGIRSTLNTGPRTPESPTYGDYSGTSMSAPVVSAGAALIGSLGTFTPAQTEAALKAAVAPFPSATGASTNFKKCSTAICGKGILDLSKVPASISGPTITGTPVVGEPLTAAPGSWNGTPSAFSYVWFRDESPITGATAATYTVTQADVDTKLSVRLAPANTVFAPIRATSPETITVPQGPAVEMEWVQPASFKYGVAQAAKVTIVDNGDVEGTVQLRRGGTVLAEGLTVDGQVELTIPGTKWVGGSNVIRAAWLGAPGLPATSATSMTVAVAKAASTNTILLAKSISKSKRAKVTVTIKVAGDPNPAGVLTVYDGSKKIVISSLFASSKGKKVITLPKLSKGYHKIKVLYAGNASISPKTSAVKSIRSY